ncbi:MAG: hypothetical protein WD075_07165 [Rhodospirillales bacterium]
MNKQLTFTELREQNEKYSLVVNLLAASLNPPIFYHSGQEHYGFRYGDPGARHFCILKAAKMISCLNGCIALAEQGFHQEIFMLIRTYIESDAQIHYVLGDLKEIDLGVEQSKFIKDFFADYQRNDANDFKRPRISQKKLHDAIGEFLDSNTTLNDPRHGGPTTASTLMSNVYLTSSNYVHARYPEIMDLYGGSPGKFHMSGMKNTPKDAESFEAISTFIESTPILLRSIIVKFKMQNVLKGKAELLDTLYK